MNAGELQILFAQSACPVCFLEGGLADSLKISLLEQIETGGGGAAIEECFQYGNYGGGQPTFIPTCDVGIGIDTSTVPATQWTWYAGAWH